MANTTHNVEPWSLPMLVPPLPWLTSFSGGYLQHRFPLVRTNRNEEHNEYIKAADEANHLTTIMRALDVLGATAWTINKNVYKTAAYFWNKKINLPGLPSDEPLPEIEKPLDLETNIKSQAWYKNECRKRKQKISNAFSERCNANYKLDIARSFLDEIIYFPHNVDFRGRAYPLPPHLNHMGDDLCRGLLLFQEKKKLGQRGLFWLQVHVSNLFGFDKASLQERVEFTKSHVNDIIDSAENPIHGKQWWLQGDKPWQLLAACFELNQAMKLEDPSEYECNLAIHQDGSCNGLQHYAALGGDIAGAEAVNLVPSDKPGDVYSGVARRVQEKVNLDVENGIPEALLMQHRINRKLVKQTVMTNTYGVTRIGARDQIQSRLREARVHEAVETRLSDEQIRKCAGYITTKVFESMTDMFQGARAIQIWLNTAARLVTSSVPSNRISKQDKLLYDTMVEFGILTKPETNSKKPQSDLVADSILAAVEQDLQNQDLEKNEEDDDDTLDEKEYITLAKKSPLKVTSMTWTSPLGFPIVQPYRKASVTQV
jgi:DNA-directed RNA polymerase